MWFYTSWLDKQSFKKLQSQALVLAGQIMFSISLNFINIFSSAMARADGILIPISAKCHRLGERLQLRRIVQEFLTSNHKNHSSGNISL